MLIFDYLISYTSLLSIACLAIVMVFIYLLLVHCMLAWMSSFVKFQIYCSSHASLAILIDSNSEFIVQCLMATLSFVSQQYKYKHYYLPSPVLHHIIVIMVNSCIFITPSNQVCRLPLWYPTCIEFFLRHTISNSMPGFILFRKETHPSSHPYPLSISGKADWTTIPTY